VATYWVSAVWRAQRKFNLPVELVIPKEGVIGWFDGLTVAKDAPHPDVAQQFIDFMVSPEFYVKWETDVGAPISANAPPDAPLMAMSQGAATVATRQRVAAFGLTAPTYLWLTLTIFLPLSAMFYFSFLTVAPFGGHHPSLTLDNYRTFFAKELYRSLAWKSLVL